MDPGPVEEYDGLTLRDFVSGYTDDDTLHLFINCLCQLYFALSYREASAGEFIWCFSRMFGDASFGYPRGGGSAIPGSYIESLKQHGGRVLFNAPADAIVVKNGTAVGVRAGGTTYPADIVISNAGIARTIELAGRKSLPADYAARADDLVYSNAYITIKYALDRPVVPYPVVFYMPDMPGPSVFDYIGEKSLPDDPYIFMPVPSNMDPSLAPPGRQLVIAGTAAPAGAGKKYCRALIERVDRRVCRLFPGIPGATIWKSTSSVEDTARITRHAAGACIGLGQVPGQTGAGRPACETPLRNLWLVGADAGARGIGTEIASRSALACIEAIRERRGRGGAS
jgi:phytoene dehydrogenase-like protein